MEGYVVVRNWSGRAEKLWGILDGQQLSLYERFDLNTQQPINIKKTLVVKNAIIAKDPNRTKDDHKFQISITTEGQKKVFAFECLDPPSYAQWFDALTVAGHLHIEEARIRDLPFQYADTLGLLEEYKSGNLSKSAIAKSYKKLCLKAHPDKGGNPEEFNRIKEAYAQLVAIVNEEEIKEICTLVDYEVMVEKVGQGVGLGIGVQEDKVSDRTAVLPSS